MRTRLRGMLIGLAVGDALGAAAEFAPPGTFPPVSGYRGGGPHRLRPGEWTDDTAMSLALADSIAAGWDLNDQARRYLAWYEHGRYSVNGSCFDIGNQTRQALSVFKRTGDAFTSGNPSEQASANGSIMRLGPVPIAFAHLYPEQVELLAERAEQSSIPTHPSPICRSACRYLALVLAALARGILSEEALSPSWSMLERLRPLHPAVEAVARGSFRQRQPPAIKGAGYVVESLEAALWAFHDARDFRGAVLRAVNLGDDADTTGAVCGQLAGACWGEEGIPREWREGLARKDLVEAALEGLLRGAAGASSPGSAPSPGTPGIARRLETTLKAERDSPGMAVASSLSVPPWSYWVVPGRLLAGCFPGDLDRATQERKLQQLLDLGIRVFVNLMEPDEKNRSGQLFADYTTQVMELAMARGIEAQCERYPTPDLGAPTRAQMEAILGAIERAADVGPVYLHCWGGVGRTGTVVACWLLEHSQAMPGTVAERVAALRAADQERGRRQWPESPAQERFVRGWATRRRGET